MHSRVKSDQNLTVKAGTHLMTVLLIMNMIGHGNWLDSVVQVCSSLTSEPVVLIKISYTLRPTSVTDDVTAKGDLK